MRALVTGAAGFIGGSIARALERQGWAVHADPRHGSPRGPLTVASLRHALDGQAPDAIVHAAGSGTVGRVAADPAVELSANMRSLVEVLEYATTHAPLTQVVLLSSASVYGNAPPVPQREDDARMPISLYGLVKAQLEQAGAFYALQHRLSVTTVRLFSVYGPGLRKQLLWDAMKKFQAGRSDFFGTGTEQRDWVHIDDVCDFVSALLAHRTNVQLLGDVPAETPFTVLNCAAGQAPTNAEVLAHLARAAGAPAPVFNGQTRPGDPQCLFADCTQARMQIGWRARVAWQDGLSDYARWFAHDPAGSSA